jgi:hypothetical protein
MKLKIPLFLSLKYRIGTFTDLVILKGLKQIVKGIVVFLVEEN